MQPEKASPEDRREFLKMACSVCLGGAIGVVPVAAGMAVYLDPLRRKPAAGRAVRVASLEALPLDGTPRLFPVIATRVDAWNRVTSPVGAIYIRRVKDAELQVFNVTCPHAGCAVEFQAAKGGYFCPCHSSLFAPDGKRSEKSPSARDLDSLKYEIRDGEEVWVQFQNFETGRAAKVPVA